jgi:hypothetical protein
MSSTNNGKNRNEQGRAKRIRRDWCLRENGTADIRYGDGIKLATELEIAD